MWSFSNWRSIPSIMNTHAKLLPRLRRREQARSSPPEPTKCWVKQPQTIVLGVLDISKEARDALAAQEQQAWQSFKIAFPPQSPTESGASCGPSGKTQEASLASRSSLPPTGPPTSPLPPLPVSRPPPAVAPLSDVLASETSRRRRCALTTSRSLLIPPMPTTPPPRPYVSVSASMSGSSMSSPRSLRRQPRFTHLNPASPIRRCRTFPLSKYPTPRSRRPLPDSVTGSGCGSSSCSLSEKDPRAQQQRSTTPAGTPAVASFPFPPRATFTKRASVMLTMPNSATRETFPITESSAGVEPFCTVKRVPGPCDAPPSSPTPSPDVAMHVLFSSLDDLYPEFYPPDELSLMSIPLSPVDSEDGDHEDVLELGREGEGAWRSRYCDSDGLPAWAILPPTSSERRTWQCAHSFPTEHRQSLELYRAQGSRSLPNLALEP